MKKNLFNIVFSLFCFLQLFVSCVKDDIETVKSVKPGIYAVEMAISALSSTEETRGIVSLTQFDEIYTPNLIYLHALGESDSESTSIELPLYTIKCGDIECRGIRYQVEILDDGSAIVRPLNAVGQLDGGEMHIDSADNIYFSSYPNNIWELPKENVIKASSETSGMPFNIYLKDNETNVELFRSEKNYTIENLTIPDEDLFMMRVCSGFNVSALFHDESHTPVKTVFGFDLYAFSEEHFESIMGTAKEKWYVKILLGGPAFTNKYDLYRQQCVQDEDHIGYYMVGGGYLQFAQSLYGANAYTYYETFGFKTDNESDLILAPVVKGQEMHLYILVKKWSYDEHLAIWNHAPGDGHGCSEDTPCEEWLNDDNDAAYTEWHDSEGKIIKPENNSFYTLALLQEVTSFKKFWDSFNSSQASSRSFGNMQYFVPENAIIINEQASFAAGLSQFKK